MIRGYFSCDKFIKDMIKTSNGGYLPHWAIISHGKGVNENDQIIGTKFSSDKDWETKRKPKPFESFTPIKKEEKGEK